MVEDFGKHIKSARRATMPSPEAMVDKTYQKLCFNTKNSQFFFSNASDFILKMRDEIWNDYLNIEENFTLSMASSLIDNDSVSSMKPKEAINYYLINNLDKLYALNLSNTNSRRSRAGKEFECILERLFKAAGIEFETQASIGKQGFMFKKIGKMVDFIFPNSQTFFTDKRGCKVLSAKTTLRERWQEVGEEISRTGLRDMYLATLEESISESVLSSMNEHNIVPVVLKQVKQSKYPNDNRIIDFEKFLLIVSKL